MNPGYAGNILCVDLSTGHISRIPTETYAARFLGGRGIGAKIYWDEVAPEVDALGPDNKLIFTTGPVCGVPGLAGSRWQVCGKSPIDNQFSYSNLGGSWGAQLKFAGFDSLIIKGKAEKLVYLYIDNNHVEIRDGAGLSGKGTIETRMILKGELGRSSRVVAVGPAGENLVSFATLLADEDASGSWGFGAVMGSKRLKAIAVRGQGRVAVADPERVKELRARVHELKDSNVMFDQHLASSDKLKKSVCYGCIKGCWRSNYTTDDGKKGKYVCQPSNFYAFEAGHYYGDARDVPFEASNLCNGFGVDTRAMQTMIKWLALCYEAGIITEDKSGLPLSKIGSVEFIESLVRKTSFRQGFGDVLARGTFKAAESIGSGCQELLADHMMKSGDKGDYGPRLYITTGLLYAMEPRTPIDSLHEISIPLMLWALTQAGTPNAHTTSDIVRNIGKRFWGSEIAADFSTYEGKALAAVEIQNRQYALESLILCGFSWPIWLWGPPGLVQTPGIEELESKICTAITGRHIDENALSKTAERTFNLQRAILVRERGKGRDADSLDSYHYDIPLETEVFNSDCVVPGKNGEGYCRKGMLVDRDEFEKMKDEYYEIRGWDVPSGLQTKSKLMELNLPDVAETLDSLRLLV